MALVKQMLCGFDQEQVHLMKNTAVEIEMYKHVLSFFTGISRFSKVSNDFSADEPETIQPWLNERPKIKVFFAK